MGNRPDRHGQASPTSGGPRWRPCATGWRPTSRAAGLGGGRAGAERPLACEGRGPELRRWRLGPQAIRTAIGRKSDSHRTPAPPFGAGRPSGSESVGPAETAARSTPPVPGGYAPPCSAREGSPSRREDSNPWCPRGHGGFKTAGGLHQVLEGEGSYSCARIGLGVRPPGLHESASAHSALDLLVPGEAASGVTSDRGDHRSEDLDRSWRVCQGPAIEDRPWPGRTGPPPTARRTPCQSPKPIPALPEQAWNRPPQAPVAAPSHAEPAALALCRPTDYTDQSISTPIRVVSPNP